HDASGAIDPDFAGREDAVIAGVGGEVTNRREVVGGVAGGAVVVGDDDLSGRVGQAASVGDLVGPGDGGSGHQDRHAGPVHGVFVVVVGGDGIGVGGAVGGFFDVNAGGLADRVREGADKALGEKARWRNSAVVGEPGDEVEAGY